MNSRTNCNERLITRICAVISACMLIGLSSGAAFGAPLDARGISTAPAAPQGPKTAAIKTAIKVVVKALRSAAALDAVALLAKESATPAVIRLAVKHAGTIATRLEVLLTYETLVLDTVKDQVVNALTKVGVKDIIARDVGYYVKLAVERAL